MFRIKHTRPVDLLKSGLFDEQSFYPALIRDLKHAKREVLIESPYMTMPRTQQLTPILRKLVSLGVKIRVHTRLPEHHNQLLRIQAYQVTKELESIGVKVRYQRDYHHRKLVIIDSRVLYEGSLNVLSQNKSREIMRRIESEELTKQMMRFLHLKPWYSYIM